MSVLLSDPMYPAGVTDNDPYFDMPSVGDDEWTIEVKPCSRGDCSDGWNYDENGWCGVCKGGTITVEVHETCGLTEDSCPCCESAEKQEAA